jgi:hypothetical protein
MPEMWIHGCQPAIKDIVMSTHIKDDKDSNKCNLTLYGVDSIPLRSIADTSPPYRISFRPNFGSSDVQIHCLLSATTGVIGLNNGSYGYKENCISAGTSAVLWRGHPDPNGLENIAFNFTPQVGQLDIKFTVTCSEGIGAPVYQHLLYIGNYSVPVVEEIQSSVALAVVVLLMIILPICGILIYCGWIKLKGRVGSAVPPPTVGKDDDEDDEEEKSQKKGKKEKYENIKDKDDD